jgi:hypothetical protein
MVYVDLRVILILHANILYFSQSALSFMIGLNSDRSAFKAWSLEPRKAISVYAYHNDLWSFAQLAISVPDWRNGLISDRMQWSYFRSHARSANQRVQISQGLLIDVPNHHTFYTHSTTYKKEGDSTHLLLLSIRTSLRTKNKGLQRYVLQIYYFINQVF